MFLARADNTITLILLYLISPRPPNVFAPKFYIFTNEILLSFSFNSSCLRPLGGGSSRSDRGGLNPLKTRVNIFTPHQTSTYVPVSVRCKYIYAYFLPYSPTPLHPTHRTPSFVFIKNAILMLNFKILPLFLIFYVNFAFFDNKKFNEFTYDIPYPKHADYWVSNINYLNKTHQT